jgi:hypothetical protein
VVRLTTRAIWQHRRTVVALIEILGASWSLVVMIRLLLGASGLVIPWWFLVLALGWFSLVGLAGVRLWRRQTGREPLSIIAQTAQLLQITTGPVAFRLLAGPQATISFLGDRFYFFAGVTSSVNLFRGETDPAFAIGLNIVALVLLLVLIPRTAVAVLAQAA